MTSSIKLFYVSSAAIFLAWIAKMHFVFGGDYLFRIGTIGILLSLVAQGIGIAKNAEIKSARLTRLFLLNCVCLFIAYGGMMLKVAHLLDTQFEKDFVLDFMGIPAVIYAILYNFSALEKVMTAPGDLKIFFYRLILLPWTLFFFSFMLYAIYSVILTTG